jgi:hypothetical protein
MDGRNEAEHEAFRSTAANDQEERTLGLEGRLELPVGPENSCRSAEVEVMKPMDCRKLDDLAQFG